MGGVENSSFPGAGAAPHIASMATGFYYDGMNLFYGALKGGPYKWLDVGALSRHLVPHDEISIVRYFTARVKSRQGDENGASLQALYLRALHSTGGISVHEGRMVTRSRKKPLDDSRGPTTSLFDPPFLPAFVFRRMWKSATARRDYRGLGFAHVLLEEEKQSDVSLAVNLVRDCAVGLVDKVIVVSNDSDLREAIEIARSFGATVGIVNPRRSRTSRHLLEVADFEIHLRQESLAKSQLPIRVRDARGRSVEKPWVWT